MFQFLKSKMAAAKNFLARQAAANKIGQMAIDYHLTGNYIDDLGRSCYDGRGINEAQERFNRRFPQAS